MRTTLGGLPAARRRCWKAMKSGSCRATTLPTMNRISRTAERPPRTARFPWCLPESLASGASPASLEMVLLESVPISGISAMMRATVRSATPLMVRKARLSWRHSGSASISAAIACSSCSILLGEELEHLAEPSLYVGMDDQPLLVQLCGAYFGQLAQTRYAGAQLELGPGRKALRWGLPGFRIPGDHAGVDGVGLF